MSEKTTGTVRFTLDTQNPPELSAKEKAQLERLASMSDDQIDFSDIPPTADEGVIWSRPGPMVLASSENKQQITLRLDTEVLAFFKSTGRRYQTRINEVLKAYVQAHKGQA